MHSEIRDIPDAARRVLSQRRDRVAELGAELRGFDPAFITTVARGSSDHAATFLKYAIELGAGVPVASVGPGIASVYHAKLKLEESVCLGISQSGQSPDIVEMVRSATGSGAMSIAITNDDASPLAGVSGATLPICAGAEKSVAATKTFVNSALAGLALLAHWKQDQALLNALETLPDRLEEAGKTVWPDLHDYMENRNSLLVLGRGPAFAMANEAALKFKETCRIHAESYSSAEVLHGPVSIIGAHYPVLVFAGADAAEAAVVSVADRLAAQGAEIFITSDIARKARPLEFVRTGHPLTQPLALIVTFYAFVEGLAVARGGNPDTPRYLKKVTETI
jgi:glucosamine--fructose-6-phosphate aminotransferase (isomerizing)